MLFTLTSKIIKCMKIENQLVCQELSIKMKSLGFKQESLFYHDIKGQKIYYGVKPVQSELDDNSFVSAYTVAELGEMLPVICPSWKQVFNEDMEVEWRCEISLSKTFNADTEADARAKMLIYLKENNLI